MSELIIRRTTAIDPDFMVLVKQLDADLAITDGEDHAFYDQFNKLDAIKHAVIFLENKELVACGAIKYFGPDTAEVKRMYTASTSRGKGYAGRVLTELEIWAAEMNFKRCILETGVNQYGAIRLYNKKGYHRIPNYGQYEGVENSYCFEKLLKVSTETEKRPNSINSLK